MPIVAKLDELGKPAWIALMVLAFCVAWPLGLAVLAFAIGSGRMGCGRGYDMSRWGRGGGMRGAGTDRNDPAARGRTARIPRLPGSFAPGQGQVGVRPVHGRAAQPPDPGIFDAELSTRFLRQPARRVPRHGGRFRFRPIANWGLDFRRAGVTPDSESICRIFAVVTRH
jgi:hypothetical protein